MSNEYKYTKLATASTIRLIKLESQKLDEKVACVIRHVEQSDFEYHALSYVWGDPTPTREIYLSNGPGESKPNEFCLFAVHENLSRFLSWAWDQNIFEQWIWTDRICLNQEDSEEIAQQVPRMGKIFCDAVMVMAWLGMPYEHGQHLIPLRNWWGSSGDPQITEDTQLAARAVLESDYWTRIWIVQEVLMA
ncbi:heterokaryon incompatibility protein-domain-containing protein, partial [Phyllosticta capitalensis]